MENYKLKLKDFIPVCGINGYSERQGVGNAPQKEIASRVDLLATYNAAILTLTAFFSMLGSVKGLESLMN